MRNTGINENKPGCAHANRWEEKSHLKHTQQCLKHVPKILCAEHDSGKSLHSLVSFLIWGHQSKRSYFTLTTLYKL